MKWGKHGIVDELRAARKELREVTTRLQRQWRIVFRLKHTCRLLAVQRDYARKALRRARRDFASHDCGGGPDTCGACCVCLDRQRRDAFDESVKERDALAERLDECGKLLGTVIGAGSLAPGESLVDPPEHAAVDAILRVVAERDAAVERAEFAITAMAECRAACDRAVAVAETAKTERDHHRDESPSGGRPTSRKVRHG